jgi:hypothetical protein
VRVAVGLPTAVAAAAGAIAGAVRARQAVAVGGWQLPDDAAAARPGVLDCVGKRDACVGVDGEHAAE